MKLTARAEPWPLSREFRISRGAKTQAHVVVVELERDGVFGRGECVPYARYGETTEGVLTVLRGIGATQPSLAHDKLDQHLPPGAARNALDCALWDLRAKTFGRPVWDLAGLREPAPAQTCFTISLGDPATMAAQAARAAQTWTYIKIKMDGERVVERLMAIEKAAPNARLVVDANESWTLDQLRNVLGHGFSTIDLIEQPLPAGNDDALSALSSPVPLCADESVHTSENISSLARHYQAVNIKLDKTGGLTEAIKTVDAAKKAGLKIMLGCMVGTSLAMAPAMMLSSMADVVDLDGPVLLARDRNPALLYQGGRVFPPEPALWG